MAPIRAKRPVRRHMPVSTLKVKERSRFLKKAAQKLLSE
jgi:hypothetical protein